MTDISQALRELLLARAAGQIDGEEFERRQAALHAELLAPTSSAAAATLPPPGGPGRTWWPWALGGVLVAVAGGLYVWLGNPGAAVAPAAAPVPIMTQLPAGDGGQPGSGGDLKVMASRLADKLAKDPGNGEGWALLAQTYLELRQHQDAAAAYARADALKAVDARMLADWADAHVVANKRRWDDQARKLVQRALMADPKNLKALALAGSEAFERADYPQAIGHWKKMKAAAPAGSMDARLADANIEEATALAAGKRPAPVQPTSAGAVIAGSVAIDAALKARAGPGAAVFVIAKATDGSPAPLAVKRLAVADLPGSFQLGDADAMVPERSLSRHGEARVFARLSLTGDAKPRPGDVSSAEVLAKLGGSPLKLELK
jgi:cytochrome c-type biogenesis protein CcmH